MEVFETSAKQWGNSLGITIPREIVQKKHIKPKKKLRVMIIDEGMERIKKAFGTLRLKMPTQKAMDEIDEGYH